MTGWHKNRFNGDSGQYTNSFHEEKWGRKYSVYLEPNEEKAKIVAEQVYDSVSNKSPGEYLQDILDKFNIRHRYKKPMCTVPELRGKFFSIDGTSSAFSESISSRNIFLDGTDQHHDKTTTPILKLINKICGNSTAYIYPTTLKQTMEDYEKLVLDKNYFSKYHTKLAQLIADDEKFHEGFNFVRYSGGVSIGKGMENALPSILQTKGNTPEQISELMARQRTLVVGIPPRYKEDESLSSHEIALFNTADMLPYSNKHTRKICANMEEGRGDWADNFIIFHHPENKNKVTVFINSRLMRNLIAIDDKPVQNIGGHRLQNYFATVGLIDSLHSTITTQGIKIGEIIKKFFSRELDLTKTNLADTFRDNGFKVLPLNEAQYSYPDKEEANIKETLVKAFRDQIRDEMIGKSGHMLLKTDNKKQV